MIFGAGVRLLLLSDDLFRRCRGYIFLCLSPHVANVSEQGWGKD
jgi:hypothetical protein